MTTRTETERIGLWERHHIIYLAIAYGFTWAFWVGAWLVGRSADVGDLLFNADLVWAGAFDDEPLTTAFWVSVLSLPGVYGPLVGGVVATRLDPAVEPADLWARIHRVGIGGRWYGLVLGILALVAGPAAVVVALTAELVPDPPDAATVMIFLLVFFAFQMLTSGTEEVGWRGYLNEKLRHGRDFWDTGWAVGPAWAVWHYPIVVMMFVQQDMAPVAIVGSLIGFSIGIVAAAILHAWFYVRTRSVFLNIFIHAAFNTIPLATVLLYEASPAATIANLALWAVVIYLKRQHDQQEQISPAAEGAPALDT